MQNDIFLIGNTYFTSTKIKKEIVHVSIMHNFLKSLHFIISLIPRCKICNILLEPSVCQLDTVYFPNKKQSVLLYSQI